MIVKLTPQQISAFWDAIKFTLVASSQVSDEHQHEYTNKALENLLAGKFQCWIVFDYNEQGNKQIHAITITSLVKDNLFGYTYMSVDYLFGFRKITDEMAMNAMEGFVAFAKANDCVKIQADTTIERIVEIMELCGMTEESVRYSYTI